MYLRDMTTHQLLLNVNLKRTKSYDYEKIFNTQSDQKVLKY